MKILEQKFLYKSYNKIQKRHHLIQSCKNNVAIVMTVLFVIERLTGTILSLLGNESGSV